MPHDSEPQPRFRIAIVGGGIAALTLAVTLGRYEHADSPLQVDVYEAGAEITTVGAGISVWQRTWSIMRDLGLYDELASEAVKSADTVGKDDMKPAFILRKSDWPREGYEFGRVMVPDGATTMHRADMVEVLVRHLPSSCSVRTSKRVVKYSEVTSESVQDHPGDPVSYVLHFANGTSAEADVVIGADGIKSKTRAAMYEYAHARQCAAEHAKEECERCSKATPKWTGTIAYRYLVPSERLREIEPKHRALDVVAPTSWSGKGKHIITYPISHGQYLNWIGFVTVPGAEGTTYPHKWVIDAPREDLVAHFSGWEPEVHQMLSCVEKPTLWAIHAIENLPISVYGRVALMGDAVHAMTTHFGAGGGQAIEDAYMLGRLLANRRTSLSHVADVFRIYQDVRLPFAQKVVQNARKVGLMYEFNWSGMYDGWFPPLVDGKDAEGAEWEAMKMELGELGRVVEEQWAWQWKERVEDQWKDVENRFEELVSVSSCSMQTAA